MAYVTHQSPGSIQVNSPNVNNAIADKVNENPNTGDIAFRNIDYSNDKCQVYNASGSAIPKGSAVSFITGDIVADGSVLPVIPFNGDTTTRWGILDERIEPKRIGDCIIGGAAAITLSGSTSTGKYVTPSTTNSALYNRNTVGIPLIGDDGSTNAVANVDFGFDNVCHEGRNVDLNNLEENGWYRLTGNIGHTPSTVGDVNFVFHLRQGLYGLQIFVATTGTERKLFVRRMNGAWGAWVDVTGQPGITEIVAGSSNVHIINGNTIAVDGGTGGTYTPYVLPPATYLTLGGVMADGTTTIVDADGTLHAQHNITIASNTVAGLIRSSDTVLVNPNTGIASVPFATDRYAGVIKIPNNNPIMHVYDGMLWIDAYQLPTASDTVKGGIMIGTGLRMVGNDNATCTFNLVDGSNIHIVDGNTIYADDTKYVAGNNISINSGNTISCTYSYTLPAMRGISSSYPHGVIGGGIPGSSIVMRGSTFNVKLDPAGVGTVTENGLYIPHGGTSGGDVLHDFSMFNFGFKECTSSVGATISIRRGTLKYWFIDQESGNYEMQLAYLDASDTVITDDGIIDKILVGIIGEAGSNPIGATVSATGAAINPSTPIIGVKVDGVWKCTMDFNPMSGEETYFNS